MAAASPIVSSVAIALFVGLDASLAVVAVLLATALVPITLPPLAALLAGVAIEMGMADFVLRLVGLVGSAFAAAWLMRRVVPAATLAARREHIDGLAVVNLVVFAVAIMDGVTAFAHAVAGLRGDGTRRCVRVQPAAAGGWLRSRSDGWDAARR